MFCSECGKELREGALFCPGCGCKVEQTPTEEKTSFEFEETKVVFPEVMDNKKKMITIGAITAGVLVCIAVVLFVMLPKGHNVMGEGNVSETETEVEETDVNSLMAYLNDTILKASPMLNVGETTVSYKYGEVDKVTDAPSMKSGLVGYKIVDLDKDGTEELLAVCLKDSEYYASVYELENEVVGKKDEVKIGRAKYYFPSSFTNNVSLMNVGEETYIFYTHQESGAVIPGYSAEVSLWKYNGIRLEPIMDIAQTEGGSSELEYTARHYDNAGNIAESNVFYRESFDESMIVSDEDGSVMASQFSRYGIALKLNMSMFEPLENMLADSIQKVEVHRCDAWVSIQGGYTNDSLVTIYYNDTNKEAHMAQEEYKNSLYNQLLDHYNKPYRAENIEYCYYDMNSDGMDEMIVREYDSGDYSYIVDYYIYAQSDNNAVRVKEEHDDEKSEFFITENGYAYNGYYIDPFSSSYHESYYRFNGETFEKVTGYSEQTNENGTHQKYIIFKNGTSVEVGKSEYESAKTRVVEDISWYILLSLNDVKYPEMNDTAHSTNDTTSNTADYVLPNSNVVYLTKSDLAGFGPEVCRVARNEIYARHGRIFTDEILKAYFESKSWYHGTVSAEDFSDDVLNEYEIANRDLILEYEKEQGYR